MRKINKIEQNARKQEIFNMLPAETKKAFKSMPIDEICDRITMLSSPNFAIAENNADIYETWQIHIGSGRPDEVQEYLNVQVYPDGLKISEPFATFPQIETPAPAVRAKNLKLPHTEFVKITPEIDDEFINTVY